MSLTQNDLQQIGAIVQDAANPLTEHLQGEIRALKKDIKEIHSVIHELLATAKQAGITLPRK